MLLCSNHIGLWCPQSTVHGVVVFKIALYTELKLFIGSHNTHGMLLCSKHMGLGAELSLPAAAVSSGGHVKLCLFLLQSSSSSPLPLSSSLMIVILIQVILTLLQRCQWEGSGIGWLSHPNPKWRPGPPDNIQSISNSPPPQKKMAKQKPTWASRSGEPLFLRLILPRDAAEPSWPAITIVLVIIYYSYFWKNDYHCHNFQNCCAYLSYQGASRCLCRGCQGGRWGRREGGSKTAVEDELEGQFSRIYTHIVRGQSSKSKKWLTWYIVGALLVAGDPEPLM